MTTAMVYTALPGDTLSSIANNISASAGVTTAQIEAANPDGKPYTLQVGQQINIPLLNDSTSTWRYTIRSGDSFANVASSLDQCHGLTYDEIETSNQLAGDAIQIGQLLNIPATSNADKPGGHSELSPTADNMGYWDWTWSGTACPQNATMSIAFSGWADVTTALQNSHHTLPSLVGSKFICIGGGNENGRFSSIVLDNINRAIQAGKLAAYDGIAYDVEGGDAGLSNAFSESFQIAKENNLKVIVTVSHSAPYGITDADALMQTFFADNNIDILSPQLYTGDNASCNNYDTTSGTTTTWTDYATCKAAVVPSMLTSSWYNNAASLGENAKDYFKQQGVTLQGYIQWLQV